MLNWLLVKNCEILIELHSHVIKVDFITKVRYENFGNYFKCNLNLLATLLMFVYSKSRYVCNKHYLMSNSKISW